MAPAEHTFVYKAADGCQIKADSYLPSAAGPYPSVVWIHGGCLIMGHRRLLRQAHRQAYLAAGFAVLSIDYRLAPETKLPAIIDDLRDAFVWARTCGPALFDLDPDRLAAVGHSAGGYLALMAGLTVTAPPAAIVSFYGYGDIIGDWYSRPDPFYSSQPAVAEHEARLSVGRRVISEAEDERRDRYYVYLRQQGLWPKEVAGHDPHAEPEWFGPFCPVQNVTASYPPTLLLHGDHDTDVPYAQSVMMAEALAAAGVEHDLIRIGGGEHGFDGDDNEVSAAAFARVLSFLKQHLTPGSGH
jgi:acetyl esterase/lipase